MNPKLKRFLIGVKDLFSILIIMVAVSSILLYLFGVVQP